jgi:hypothetical protein
MARGRSTEPVVDSGASKQEEEAMGNAVVAGRQGWYEMREDNGNGRCLIRVVFDTEKRRVLVTTPEDGITVIPRVSNSVEIGLVEYFSQQSAADAVDAIEGWGGWTSATPEQAVELQQRLDSLKREARSQ